MNKFSKMRCIIICIVSIILLSIPYIINFVVELNIDSQYNGRNFGVILMFFSMVFCISLSALCCIDITLSLVYLINKKVNVKWINIIFIFSILCSLSVIIQSYLIWKLNYAGTLARIYILSIGIFLVTALFKIIYSIYAKQMKQ